MSEIAFVIPTVPMTDEEIQATDQANKSLALLFFDDGPLRFMFSEGVPLQLLVTNNDGTSFTQKLLLH